MGQDRQNGRADDAEALTMEVLRTPDDRFADLPDFPFAAHHAEVGDASLRLAYVDEGPRDAPVVLLMHGEPTWSFLYRHVIAALAADHRVIAPDLIGFGRSDKPAAQDDYTYERHVAWMLEWFDSLDLRDVTLFCQDWGGLIGLRLVAACADRFARVIAAEVAAYDAPFPDERYKAGARVFPRLVPVTPEYASVAGNVAAWRELERFDRPFLTAFSDSDPVTKGGERVFQQRVPGAAGQPHVTLRGGHFLQEDCPDEIATLIRGFVAAA